MQIKKVIAGVIVGATLIGLIVDGLDLYDRFSPKEEIKTEKNVATETIDDKLTNNKKEVPIKNNLSDEMSLDGMNLNTKVIEYLNFNEFHFTFKDNAHDYYSSMDDGVIVTVAKSTSKIRFIDVVKPGHPSNKGIEVGMDRGDVEKAYGKIYSLEEYKNNRNIEEENYGVCYSMKKRDLSNYDEIDYQGAVSSLVQGESADGLIFVINRKTDKVVMISYYSSMHMRKDLEGWILQYGIPLK